MRRVAVIALLGAALAGCGAGGPTDADQQKLAKDFSAENVAKEYEKKGMHQEAAEVRNSMKQQGQ